MDEVQVYIARTGQFKDQLSLFQSYLSASEKQRAGSFLNHSEGFNYIIRHGLLRNLLSGYTNRMPAELELFTGPNQRPFLFESDISYSMSASDNFVAFCFGKEMQLGIDIESYTTDPDFAGIVKNFFSKNEIEFLEHIPDEFFSMAFLKIWTAKEAFIKANKIVDPADFTITFSEFPNRFNPLEFEGIPWFFYTPGLSSGLVSTLVSDKDDLRLKINHL